MVKLMSYVFYSKRKKGREGRREEEKLILVTTIVKT